MENTVHGGHGRGDKKGGTRRQKIWGARSSDRNGTVGAGEGGGGGRLILRSMARQEKLGPLGPQVPSTDVECFVELAMPFSQTSFGEGVQMFGI